MRRTTGPAVVVPRSGLTILEVIIAIGIFLASATVVAQLLGSGTRAAIAGRHRSQMTLLAESKMAEFTSGVREIASVNNQNFDEEGYDEYTWSVASETSEQGGGSLLLVTVTVEHSAELGESGDSFKLTRLMRDPQTWIDAAEAAAAAEEEAVEEEESAL